MATKKKKKENKKKSNSRPSFGNKHGKLYVVEDLEKIMNAVFLPQTTAFDKQLAMAAAYASDVVEYANKVILLSDGKVEKIGNPVEVLSDDELMKECKLISPYPIEIYKYLKLKGKDIDINRLKFNELLEELDRVLL